MSAWLVFTSHHKPFKPGILCHCFSLPNYLLFFFSFLSTFASKRKRGGALLCLTWSINFSFPRPATSTQGVYLAEMQRGGTKAVLRQKKCKNRPQRRKRGGRSSLAKLSLYGDTVLAYDTINLHLLAVSISIDAVSLLHYTVGMKLQYIFHYSFLKIDMES